MVWQIADNTCLHWWWVTLRKILCLFFYILYVCYTYTWCPKKWFPSSALSIATWTRMTGF